MMADVTHVKTHQYIVKPEEYSSVQFSYIFQRVTENSHQKEALNPNIFHAWWWETLIAVSQHSPRKISFKKS